MSKQHDRPPMRHELKCWPGCFAQVRSGAKTAEMRRDDRDFQVGDTMALFCWSSGVGYHDYAPVEVIITHILRRDGTVCTAGLAPGYCLISFQARRAATEVAA